MYVKNYKYVCTGVSERLHTAVNTLNMLKHVIPPPHPRRGLVIAMVISLIFIVLLRFLAGVMIWVMIILVILVIGYGKILHSEKLTRVKIGMKKISFLINIDIYILYFNFLGIFHCYMEFAKLKREPGADVTIRDLGLQTDFSIYLQIKQTWLAFCKHEHTLIFCNMSLCEGLMDHVNQLHSLLCSDYPGYCGGRHHLATHLPQEENPHRHCSHQRG